MIIAVLGTGKVGHAIIPALQKAGHDVRAGSRHASEVKGLDAPVTDFLTAASPADLVINATPGVSSLDALTAVGRHWLDGKTILDLANALDDNGDTVHTPKSLAEKIQQTFPQARVVKALNTFNTSVMTNPGILNEPTTTYVASDDAAAKAIVIDVVHSLGWPLSDIIDLGGLQRARALEHFFLLYDAHRKLLGHSVLNIKLVTHDVEV